MSDKRQKSSGKGKRTRVCDIYGNAEDQYMCLERAGMLLERLDTALPKFAKCMLPTNVVYSFWLILPKKFCIMHLPEHDTTVTLVDEFGKEFETKYLKARQGLSGGWRGFSIAQKLLQGDILLFHLVDSCKLQVHIVRRYGLEAVEAAVCLMEMHPRVKRKRALTSEKPKHEKIKFKRTKRYPKKHRAGPPNWRLAQMDTVEDGNRCDDTSNALNSSAVEGSSSDDWQPDQHGCGAPNMCYENGINCGSEARKIYYPTVAT
ncbi:hypothetical protein M8C21_010211 [Ambrosia artemisiifolia]|uniref:TF-B3 domain-containing protein n=1 Tax=Ambrosia artemisiifolia TaxID=4212 RepID=A0AAD5GHY5_AMBAR|nr:hypothetical protein M8C21_010211 [Ambrosia artemisiifolia]